MKSDYKSCDMEEFLQEETRKLHLCAQRKNYIKLEDRVASKIAKQHPGGKKKSPELFINTVSLGSKNCPPFPKEFFHLI